MRLYACHYCALTLYFENTSCVRCRSELGFWAETDSLAVLEPVHGQPDLWTAWSVPGRQLRRCANHRFGVCNWVVDARAGADALCTACRHNRVVPDYHSPLGRIAWTKLESAKHRLFLAFHRLGLVRVIEAAPGGVGSLGFQFLEDRAGAPPVMTGHANGVITIATTEALDDAREQRRVALGEPYRTLLGHFRHESAHYFWERLVRDRGREAECRAVFGDHSIDYQAALARYYSTGAPPNWQATYVSAYATMHPWEDFAETWAHYLHMIATLDTAYAYQLRIAPLADRFGFSRIDTPVDPLGAADFSALIIVWLPLTTMLNSLNAAIGKDDAYPFVLTDAVIAKLAYVHGLIRDAVQECATTPDDLFALLRT